MAPSKTITHEEEITKCPGLREADIELLRNWCDKQPHLPNISDKELALFLHSNYYYIEPTKATIENYYTVRSHVPEFFQDRDPLGSKELRQAFKNIIYLPLEKLSHDGYKIFYGRLLDSDASRYNCNNSLKYLIMVIDLWLRDEDLGKGHILLIDFDGVTFGHAGRISPITLKKFLYYLQEALPVRLKGFHIMNATPAMDIILGMMKPFMKKQLFDMLHTHTTNESLAKFMPLDGLPVDCGGKVGKLEELRDRNVKWLEDNRSWFLEEETTMRINESLRPGKAKNSTDIFGVDGSFKKLEID